jgi:hypothetical protein
LGRVSSSTAPRSDQGRIEAGRLRGKTIGGKFQRASPRRHGQPVTESGILNQLKQRSGKCLGVSSWYEQRLATITNDLSSSADIGRHDRPAPRGRLEDDVRQAFVLGRVDDDVERLVEPLRVGVRAVERDDVRKPELRDPRLKDRPQRSFADEHVSQVGVLEPKAMGKLNDGLDSLAGPVIRNRPDDQTAVPDTPRPAQSSSLSIVGPCRGADPILDDVDAVRQESFFVNRVASHGVGVGDNCAELAHGARGNQPPQAPERETRSPHRATSRDQDWNAGKRLGPSGENVGRLHPSIHDIDSARQTDISPERANRPRGICQGCLPKLSVRPPERIDFDADFSRPSQEQAS